MYRENNAQSIILCALEFKLWHMEPYIIEIVPTKFCCGDVKHEYNTVHVWESDILFCSIDLWSSATGGRGTARVYVGQ